MVPFYTEFSLFLLWFSVAGSHYSLLKSPQPGKKTVVLLVSRLQMLLLRDTTTTRWMPITVLSILYSSPLSFWYWTDLLSQLHQTCTLYCCAWADVFAESICTISTWTSTNCWPALKMYLLPYFHGSLYCIWLASCHRVTLFWCIC